MVISIARQSVIIKCRLQKSIMVGNYEFYYGAGLLSKITGVPIEKGEAPKELKERIAAILETHQTEDARESHLIKMLKYYEPSEEKDTQMEELFLMGTGETSMWQE